MTIALVLGAGFIGSNIAESLLTKGYQVKLFDISFKDTSAHLKNTAECIQADFCNYSGWQDILHDVDYVFHNICTTVPATADDNPVSDIDNNVIGNVKLLRELVKTNVKKIVFSSSGGTIYGEPVKLPVKETHPTDPITSYAISKLAVEKYLNYFNYHYGLNYISLRYGNAYGIGQNPGGILGAVTIFLRRLMDKQPIIVYGNGEAVRDYVYIDDIVKANYYAVEKQTQHRIFNVGTGKGTSIRELIELIFQVTGERTEIRYLNKRGNDVSKNILDIALIKKELQWEPNIKLKDGILRIWNHFDK